MFSLLGVYTALTNYCIFDVYKRTAYNQNIAFPALLHCSFCTFG